VKERKGERITFKVSSEGDRELVLSKGEKERISFK